MQYFIKEKVFSFKDKFDITNEQQELLYQVEGKMFSFKNKLDLLLPSGEQIMYAEKKLFKIFPEFNIYSPTGEPLARIKQRFGFRPKFDVFEGHNELRVEGNFIAHSFTVEKNGKMAASIIKKYFSFGDSYMIDVLDENSSILYMFIVIIIDQIAESNRRRSN